MRLLLLGALHGKLLDHAGSGLPEVHEQPGQVQELIKLELKKKRRPEQNRQKKTKPPSLNNGKMCKVTTALIFFLELYIDQWFLTWL